MEANLINKRLQDLEDNIKKDLDLLKKYEDELRYSNDPRDLARFHQEIERQKESAANYQQEYDELKAKISTADREHLTGLLKEKESGLANLQKMLPEIWNIAQFRNRNFTGREQIMAELRSCLTSAQPEAWKQALWGMGGVGKTQIAVEYAYRHMADYKVIWWVRSEPATLASDYALLAVELHLPEKDLKDQIEIVRAVRRWLEKNPRWLMIFDSAIKPDDLGDYLPRFGEGHVIITSRNPNWGSTAKPLQIQVFSDEESIEFLEKRTGQKDDGTISNLAKDLENLPLALEQAGAYIEEKGITFRDYLKRFQKYQIEVLERGKPKDYPATIATTWKLAFQEVQEVSLIGANLLNLCSFLAPENIPRLLLTELANKLPDPLPSLADELEFDDAVAVLRCYSLVSSFEDYLSIHRLVQMVTRERLGDDGKKWAEAALRLIHDAFPYYSMDVRTWTICSILFPHALTTVEYGEVFEVSPEVIGSLLNRIGLFLRGRGELTHAKFLLERALKIDEKILPEDHSDVATVTNNLGMVFRDLGDLKQARDYLERALKIDEKILPEDHPMIATIVSNLGLVLKDMGDLEQARDYLERALKIDEKILPEDHPMIATIVSNLGLVLKDMGDLERARDYLERALKIDEKILPENHPDVALIASNLGMVLGGLGDLDQAKNYLERALKIDEKILPEDHPMIATIVSNLGLVLKDMGDLEQARDYLERALKIDEKILPEDHPMIATIVSNLGLVLKDMGDLERARDYLERVLKIDEKILPEDHPDTKFVRDSLKSLGNKS